MLTGVDINSHLPVFIFDEEREKGNGQIKKLDNQQHEKQCKAEDITKTHNSTRKV